MNIYSPKVLIIDDIPANIHILNEALQQNYQVLFATSGEEGLILAQDEQPDIILLDVMMPGMDGYEVCRRLKRNPLTHDLPVIFVTALGDLSSEMKGLEIGAVDYLTKPVNIAVARLRIRTHIELKRVRSRLKVFFANAFDGIIVTDMQGQIFETNWAFAKMLGYSESEILARRLYEIDADRTRDELLEQLEQLSKTPALFETRYRRKDGLIVPVEISATVIPFDEQRHVFSVCRDISERKQAEHALRLAASVFEHAHEGILITDPDGSILDVNSMFSKITGYNREEIVGKNPRLLQSGYHNTEFYQALWHSLQTKGHWYGEIWNRRKNGEIYAQITNISVVPTSDGKVAHYISIFTDVTLSKKYQRQIERMAHYDGLTQLPNRTLLADRLQMAVAQRSSKYLAVAYLDLDGFKPINDMLGHLAGDQALIEVAKRLRNNVRVGDTVARIGGDEFVVLLSGLATPDECKHAFNRILSALAEPYFVASRRLDMSASIGITLYPQDNVDPDTLIRHADQAMYIAKQAGRNRCVFFNPAYDRDTISRCQLLTAIETGLARGEFVLFYQPRVDMRQARILGAEALIRWQHPERGLLPPAEFLPLIEEDDLGIALGEWVLAEALQQWHQWHRQGLKIQVSVNIARRHLQSAYFLSRLRTLLCQYEILPEMLELEVLETATIKDIEQVFQVITECRQLGIHIALDDFGAGYSSLSYFRRLPIHTLKIDQSLVRNMLANEEDIAIVKSVIELAHAFRRTVVAEGVETSQHGLALLQMGCDWAQGYSIARPMSAAALSDWITAYRGDPLWIKATHPET